MGLKAMSRTIAGAVDYEEGSWTPVLEGTTAAGVHTYNGRDGTYIKMGPTVFAWFQINLDALGTAGDAPSGNAQIAGLPYAARDDTPEKFLTFPAAFADVSNVDINVGSSFYSVYGRVFPGSSAIRLRISGDSVAATNLDVTDVLSTSLIIGCAIYLSD